MTCSVSYVFMPEFESTWRWRLRGRTNEPGDGLRVEVPCTRADEHPANGEHWHEPRADFRVPFKITWTIPSGPWMA